MSEAPSTLDPRVREFMMPTRIVWHSGENTENTDALLIDDDSVAHLSAADDDRMASILLDFGRELHGGVRIDCPTTSTGKPARARVRFGESCSEAMGEPNNDHSIHDIEMLIPWMGHTEVGNTGFRFVRIDLLDTETSVNLHHVRAVSIFRPYEYKGAFECDDALLNAIWLVGAYTVHLCMQDHVWDGIKRDRLVWIGDLHPETMVAATVFGDVDVVPASLNYVRDRTPLPQWMNGISSYSLWWLVCHHDWYRYHGNLTYLSEQREYMVGLLALLEEKLCADGVEHLDGARFLEWPTSGDPTAIDLGLQALIARALAAGADMLRVLDEPEAASRAEDAHARAAAAGRAASASKQANALRVLSGMADAVEVNGQILADDPHRGLSTFYGYYVLQARAMAGDYAGCLDLIRAYWGGMLEMGATTFWEGFDIDWMENSGGIDELAPEGMKDIHADFGDWCYKGLRHSLCHGWAAGPTAWLSEHVLGISPVEPGFAKVRIAPNLAGLRYAKGAMPTPHGLIRVEHTLRADGSVASDVLVPEGVEVVTQDG